MVRLSRVLAFASAMLAVAVSWCGAGEQLTFAPAVVVRAPQSGGQWSVMGGDFTELQPTIIESGSAAVVYGSGRVLVLWTGDGKILKLVVPLGPVDPNPTPTPIPVPEPIPPKPITSLYVLVVEETNDRQKLPAGQREIILGTGAGSVREYLEKHCQKAKDGTPEFRFYDTDDTVDNESPIWKEVWNRPRASLPWIVIANGQPKGSGGQGYEGPLPKTVAETLSLLRKYGGQ